MNSRRSANPTVAPLLDLIEKRFDLCLPDDSAEHLHGVHEHYLGKRNLLLWQHGEAGALAMPDYAKAVLISEAARLMLREIDPWPRRKKFKKGTS
jgi:hypothetical protein